MRAMYPTQQTHQITHGADGLSRCASRLKACPGLQQVRDGTRVVGGGGAGTAQRAVRRALQLCIPCAHLARAARTAARTVNKNERQHRLDQSDGTWAVAQRNLASDDGQCTRAERCGLTCA